MRRSWHTIGLAIIHAVALFLILILLGVRPGYAHANQPPLILAVHPYLPATEIVTRFTPLSQYLSQALGRPVQVRVGIDYAEHITAIGEDRVDIAYMGPAPYVKLVTLYGKKPLLARQQINNQPHLRGVIIVRRDSPLIKLTDLKGKRFAYGDVESTMSHIVPRHMMQRAGVPENALAGHAFLGSHSNVVLAVLSGDYDAGAVKEEVFQAHAAKGLRVLAESLPVADHNFVASSRLLPAMVDKLRRSLWQMKDSAKGRTAMNAIHPNMNALVPALDSNYDSLRAIIADTP